jgi:RimJ/RimL family protein N-acetyltransferase
MLRHLARALPAAYALRPRTEADLPFLRELYAQSRAEELAPVPWTAHAKREFLDDQFGKQHAHYLQHYPTAQWWIVTCDGAPVGRLYVARTPGDLRVMDVTLAAAHRKHGIGTALMRALLRHAGEEALAVTLHVEPFNPAMRLYLRLGFAHVETRGVYHFMRRPPSVEDDLVADVRRVPADRDHEQLQPAVGRV